MFFETISCEMDINSIVLNLKGRFLNDPSYICLKIFSINSCSLDSGDGTGPESPIRLITKKDLPLSLFYQ